MAKQSVVGYYETENEAINAIEDLKREGYRTEEISVISKDREETKNVTDETGTQAGEGAAAGAVAGGALGGLGGVLAGIGALAIPGIGPLVAAGPIAAGLTGAAAGAGVGGLAGALIGMGVPEEEANEYEEHVNEGKILVLVENKGDRLVPDQNDQDVHGVVVERTTVHYNDTDSRGADTGNIRSDSGLDDAGEDSRNPRGSIGVNETGAAAGTLGDASGGTVGGSRNPMGGAGSTGTLGDVPGGTAGASRNGAGVNDRDVLDDSDRDPIKDDDLSRGRLDNGRNI